MTVLEASVSLSHGAFSLKVDERIPLSGVTALFGRSGSGKTTLLRIIAGLEPGAAGRVAFNGEDWQDGKKFVPPHRRPTGYVFQDARLFQHLSVARNLEFAARRAQGETPSVKSVVDAFDLGYLLGRRPQALSGGEKQRVAIARALLSAPRLMLMDEPLSSLDEGRKSEILPYLEKLRDETKIPILYVSHSAAEVARLANHVVLLEAGRVVRQSPAGSFFADADAAPLVGAGEAGAVIEARIAAHLDDGLTELAFEGGTLLLPQLARPEGQKVRVRIPAQDILLALKRPEAISALNVLETRIVSLREGDGPGVLVTLQCGETRLLARITGRSAAALALAPGMPCFAIIKSVAVAQSSIGPLFSGQAGTST